jgi:hypothetical protein
MRGELPRWFGLTVVALCALGVVGCVAGAIANPAAFARAWLCSYLFWLGVPLAGLTLILVHDLTGGDWMGTARPVLDAAVATMPLVTLAGIPAFLSLHSLYPWTNPGLELSNAFYLNVTDFLIRYAIYIMLWNALAAFALWVPREGNKPIVPALSWISGVGLVVLAFSAGFASIDWILSLEPKFWSSVFPYIQPSSWFNTGLAAVLLTITLRDWSADRARAHLADLSRILLATTIFWAYVEFMQFLIVWESNLKTEIPWYLKRLDAGWQPAIYVSAGFGFVVPFLVLLWAPPKRHGAIVGTICALILISRVANTWLLVLPEFEEHTPFWLSVATLLALGGAVVLLFSAALTRGHLLVRPVGRIWSADHT